MENKDTLQIEKASREDLTILLQVARKAFVQAFTAGNKAENVQAYLEEAFTLSQFEKEIAVTSSSFFLAKVDEKAVGYIKLNETPSQTDIHDPDSLEIARLYLLEEYLGKGYGKQLLHFAFDLARKKEKTYLWLGVWEHNTKAIRFYEKNGLRIFGSHPFPFGDELQTDYLMRIDF